MGREHGASMHGGNIEAVDRCKARQTRDLAPAARRSRRPLVDGIRALFCGVLACVFAGGALPPLPLEANDAVLVPAASAVWRSRLRTALTQIRNENYSAGLETLQRALTQPDGVLYEVRNPLLLERPLEFQIDDEVLVPEKKVVTSSRRRRNFRTRPAQPAEPFEPQKSRHFLALPVVAEALLRALPEPALRAYRERYNDRARFLLTAYLEGEEPGDPRSGIALLSENGLSTLETLAGEFFATTAGQIGAELLGDVYWEQGRFDAAVVVWRRLLRDLEAGSAPRSRVTAKIRRATTAQPFVTTSPRVVQLDAWLDPALPAPSRWGGEFTLGALPAVRAESLQISWKSPFVGGMHRGSYSFVPLVDGDFVYAVSPHAIHRLNALPGHGSVTRAYRLPLPGQPIRQPERHSESPYVATLWKRSLEPWTQWWGLPEEIIVTTFINEVVTPGEYLGYTITEELPVRGLIAFDVNRPEKPLWKHSEAAVRDPLSIGRQERTTGYRKFKEDGHSAGEKGLSYRSPVIVKEGLVVAGGWVQRGYVNSVLRAHDLRDGELVWESLLASFQLEQTMFGELAREPFAGAILEDDGVVYYATQLGSVMAVELATGRAVWGMTYDTIPVEKAYGRRAKLRETYWGPNPLLVVDGVLIVTPRDSRFLYAIDTGRGPDGPEKAGQVLWGFYNETGDLEDLLGHHDGCLYFVSQSSDGGIARLDVQMGADGRLLSSSPGPGGMPSPALTRTSPALSLGPQVGPAALTAQGILTVDGNLLKIIDFQLETVERLAVLGKDTYPRFARRLQVADGIVFIASPNTVSAYVEHVDGGAQRF